MIITNEDYLRIEKYGIISEEDIKKYQGICLHFCQEWDYLLIDKSFPEFECCTCLTRLKWIKDR